MYVSDPYNYFERDHNSYGYPAHGQLCMTGENEDIENGRK